MSYDAIKFKRGWDRRNSDSMGTITWTEATYTFTIAPKSGQDEFYFWSNGKLFTKTSSESIQLPDISGIYYIYYDENGTLQYILNADWTENLFETSCITGLAYWNTTQNKLWFAIDEQHGIIMDASTHFRLHMRDGAVWLLGGNPTGLVDASDTYTNIGTGVYADEDINFVTPLATTHSFMYRDGANGDWRETALDNKCGHIVSGDTYCCYNQNTSGTNWQLTECTSSTDFVIMFFLWTNFDNSPIKKIIGQKTYSSRRLAREGLKTELTAISLAGLSTSESHFLFAYIVKRNGDLEDDGDGNAYVDLRTNKGYNLPDME